MPSLENQEEVLSELGVRMGVIHTQLTSVSNNLTALSIETRHNRLIMERLEQQIIMLRNVQLSGRSNSSTMGAMEPSSIYRDTTRFYETGVGLSTSNRENQDFPPPMLNPFVSTGLTVGSPGTPVIVSAPKLDVPILDSPEEKEPEKLSFDKTIFREID